MKECQQISELCFEMHDGSLDESTAASVHAHLDQCSTCREDFQWYSFTVRTLGNVEELQPPRDFLQQLNAKIHPEKFSLFDYIKDLLNSAPAMPIPVGISALAVVLVASIVLVQSPNIPFWNSSSPTPGPISSAAPQNPFVTPTSMPIATSVSISSPAAPMSGTPKALSSVPWRDTFPTVGGMLNRDVVVSNLQTEEAIESLKKVLPSIRGTLIEENRPDAGKTVLAVKIPKETYAQITSELIKHGAVSVRDLQAADNHSEGDMLLYIQFVR